MAREMKDSGFEWIGEIPVDWLTKKIKHNFTVFAGATPKSEKKEYWDGDISWITPADYKTEDKYVCMGRKNISIEGYKSCGTTIVPKGSVIFSKRAPVGTVAISGNELCTNQGCLSCVPHECVDCVYYYFVLSVFTEQFELLSTGTTFKEISVNSFVNFPLPFPIYKEQIQISSFLSKKCVEIDNVLSKTRTSIEEYKKLKQALITQAVTKGLDSNAEMKDSGIEWVGNIPSNWNIHPIYYSFGERKNKNSSGQENNLLSLSYGNIVRKDINSNEGLLPESFKTYNIIETGDIIIRPTDLQNDKRSLRTGIAKEHGIITSAYIALMPIRSINAAYYHYQLHAFDVMKVFYNMGNGIRQGLNFREFSHLRVIEPPREEQDSIVEYLDEKCKEIDYLIAKKEKYVAEIENYKKSFIYEYVTGKKEVPQEYKA